MTKPTVLTLHKKDDIIRLQLYIMYKYAILKGRMSKMKRRFLWSLAITVVLILALAIGVNAQESNSSVGYEDIFDFKGYSVSLLGTDVCLGFDVDYEAKAAYEKEIGKTVDIGIIFAPYDSLNGQTPLDENGQPRVLNQGKVVKVSLNDYNYLNYDFKLVDFSEELADYKIIISPYMYDGTNVFYYQENGKWKTKQKN